MKGKPRFISLLVVLFAVALFATVSIRVHATSLVSITITDSPVGSGLIYVDGNLITTPNTFSWTIGSTHALYAKSNTVVVNQEQYVYTSWSNDGSQTQTYTVPSSNATVTANYQLQYYLTVTGGNSESGQGWYNAGATANASSNWVWNTVAGQSRTAITNYELDGTSQNLIDNFAGATYNIVDGQTSSNGLWTCQYAGYGETGVTTVNGKNVFFIEPQAPTSPSVGHAGLVATTLNYANFTANVEVNTASQLRQNSAPNPWEVAWVFFRYTNSENFYYVLFANNDLELGKYQGNLTQLYCYTTSSGPTFTLGDWTDYQISAVGNHIQFWLNGTEVINYVDTTMSPQLASGAVVMYDESSLTYWANMTITNTPSEAPTNNQNPTLQTSGNLMTPSITMNVAHTIQFASTTQYYLTVSSAHGSPTGQGWYNSGTSASFNVTTPSSGYTFTSWAGSGTESYTGLAISESATMNNPITEVASWTSTTTTTTSTTTKMTISDFDSMFAESNVSMIYPSNSTTKPLGCGAASVSDWLASMAISTKLGNYTEGLDTESMFVNQSTGRAIGNSGTGIISFGGQYVNPVVKYAEIDSTPLQDRAPIRFHYDSVSQTDSFQLWNGSTIPGASLPSSIINQGQDMFVIEVYKDASNRPVMLCYGFGWKGTYAAGKYFNTMIYPNLASYPYSWVIVKWNDTNGDGFVNNPGDGDTYTIVAVGPS
ncbi:MAG: DUF1080 domain-containing protein [Nitrososphaeria archaeon]